MVRSSRKSFVEFFSHTFDKNLLPALLFNVYVIFSYLTYSLKPKHHMCCSLVGIFLHFLIFYWINLWFEALIQVITLNIVYFSTLSFHVWPLVLLVLLLIISCFHISLPSFLLSRYWGHSARSGSQAPAAYHRRKEGLDQHPGSTPQAPAPKLPGPRVSS